MSKKKIITIAAIVLVVVAVAVAYSLYAINTGKNKNNSAPTVTDITASVISATSTSAASSTNPLRQVLANMSYGLKRPQTKLINGYYVGKFEDCGRFSCNGITYYSHMKLDDLMAEGDLNGDGINDAAVVMDSVTTQSASNEGIQYSTQVIAAVVKQGDTYKNIAAIELTDDLKAQSTAIESLSIKNGVIYATILKNKGSMNLSYPTSTEKIQLKLSASSTSGFELLKNGIPVNTAELKQSAAVKI